MCVARPSDGNVFKSVADVGCVTLPPILFCCEGRQFLVPQVAGHQLLPTCGSRGQNRPPLIVAGGSMLSLERSLHGACGGLATRPVRDRPTDTRSPRDLSIDADSR